MTTAAIGFDARAAAKAWRPPPLIEAAWLRYLVYGGALAYLVLDLGTLEVNWARAAEGLERGARFLGGFFPPDFVTHWHDIEEGLLESLTMTITSTVSGVLLSVPVALGAARNLAPLPIYLICRGIIAVSRTFQEVIIAILFVAMFGFGPLAGMITVAFSTIGFLAKLLAEDIEDIEKSQAAAVRATGASWFQLLAWGIQPQVLPRFIGLTAYRFDINFRESAVLGLVGAGGIGLQLQASIATLAWPQVSMILLLILGTVVVSEWLSARVRHAII